MPGHDLALLREILELGEIPAHVVDQELDLGPGIILDAEGEKTGRAEHHATGLLVGEAKAAEVVELGEEGVLHAGDEEESGAAAAEEVEGGA